MSTFNTETPHALCDGREYLSRSPHPTTKARTRGRECGLRGAYWQGAGWPFEQTTVEPGGTTIVVLFFGGGGLLLLKLRQPPSPRGSTSSIRRNARMATYLTQSVQREYDGLTGSSPAPATAVLAGNRLNGNSP
jgi:hypothetical protein